MSGFNIVPANMDEAYKFSQMISHSNLIPKEYRDKPEEIMVAGAYGAKLGLDVFESLQSIAVINGRTCLWGDGLLAICMPYMEAIIETFDPNTNTAYCEIHRKGLTAPIIKSFSWEDAVIAKLANKGTWQQYPRIMLEKRARAFALRTAFADKLHGVYAREEMSNEINPVDIPVSTIETQPSSPAKLEHKSKANDILDKLAKRTKNDEIEIENEVIEEEKETK